MLLRFTRKDVFQLSQTQNASFTILCLPTITLRWIISSYPPFLFLITRSRHIGFVEMQHSPFTLLLVFTSHEVTLKHVFAYTPIEPPRALKTYFCGKNISRNRTDLSVVSFSTMLTLSPSTDATFTGVSTVQEHFIYRRIWKTFATTCHITISLAEPLHSMNQFLKK